MLQPFAEMLKGFTDLPIVLLALWFGLQLWRRYHGAGGWAALYLLIAISGIFGAVVHIFVFPRQARNGIWVVLYVFLYELVRRASFLLCRVGQESPQKESRFVFAAEGVFYVVTVIGLFVFTFNEIYIFALFAALALGRALITLSKIKPPRKLLWLFGLLGAAVAVQLLTAVSPYFIAIEHLLLSGALIIAYQIARKK